MKWKDIQYLAAGVDQYRGNTGILQANEIAFHMGATGIPTINVSNGCAMGVYTLKAVCDQIRLGVCDVGMAAGGGKSPGGFYPMIPPVTSAPLDLQILRWKLGLPNPAYWAMAMMRRMRQFGDTEELMAKIRVKSSKGGAANPYARYHTVYTVEEVLNSRMVCYPLRLYEICAVSQGAAAVIVGSMDMARRRTTKPITIAATGTASPLYGDATLRMHTISAGVKETAPYLSEGFVAARRAFEEAGIGPEDIDIAEIPDNCPWHELGYFEADGFCKPGEAGHLVEEGYTDIGGKLPVNMSGGMLSYGEVLPAQGLQQVCDCVKQMKGQAPRQVEKSVRTAFCQSYAGHGSNGVAILKC
jgi:acetyl-CoA acetyltransferase